MDERSILTFQIENLRHEIGRTEVLFEQNKSALAGGNINAKLRERVNSRLAPRFKQQRTALDAVKRVSADGQPLKECWKKFRLVKQECSDLFQECLALMHGALGRSAGLDDGLCVVADALLNHLGHLADIEWDRFTILGEGESFCDMAQVIRLRYPGVNIWNLAVVGHEFGHFVSQELKVRRAGGSYYYPLREFVDGAERDKPREAALLSERIADLLAVYSLGPSVALTCILLRFDPGVARESGKDHPCDAERVHLILRTLNKMGDYRQIIDQVSNTWRSGLAAAGVPLELDPGVEADLDSCIDNIYELVDERLARIRYGGWTRAQGLIDELSKDNAKPTLAASTKLADILNAAWLCRLSMDDIDNFQVTQLGERALNACKSIIPQV
jgi:hypothetical protein